MKAKSVFPIVLFALGVAGSKAYAGDQEVFTRIYDDWTAAFNRKDADEACKLFATHVVADFPGIPTKTYPGICANFRKMFQEANRQYHYRYEFRNVYRSGNLAAIRITWFLTTAEKGQQTILVEQGLDVLEKNPAGKWQIVNWISYDEPENKR